MILKMTGTLRYPRQIWESLSFRELFIQFQAYDCDQWDHTAIQAMFLYGVQCCVVNTQSKQKLPLKKLEDFHPYLVAETTAVTDISQLRTVFGALCSRQR